MKVIDLYPRKIYEHTIAHRECYIWFRGFTDPKPSPGILNHHQNPIFTGKKLKTHKHRVASSRPASWWIMDSKGPHRFPVSRSELFPWKEAGRNSCLQWQSQSLLNILKPSSVLLSISEGPLMCPPTWVCFWCDTSPWRCTGIQGKLSYLPWSLKRFPKPFLIRIDMNIRPKQIP